MPDFLTCTEQLQRWNQPRPKKLEVIPVVELGSRKDKILKKENQLPVPSRYDPRPSSMRHPNTALIESMRVSLLAINSPCVLLQLLVPPVEVALHDHTYVSSDVLEKLLETTCAKTSNEKELYELTKMIALEIPNPLVEKMKLNVSQEERKSIEEQTRCQSKSSLWHVVRARRITGSRCGRILRQIQRTDALLIDILYRRPMDPKKLPAPIKWGIENECKAREAYTTHMRKEGQSNLVTSACGFIIHPTMGWLGASPDAFVTDPSEKNMIYNGIVEFKCPFSKKNISPIDACSDPGFYCHVNNGQLHLKHDHIYYHQVQLQLFVTMDTRHWCDFCVYTLQGVAIERIWLDSDWCNKYILELESYFDGYMLPEITFPKLKPSYVL